MLRKVRSSYTYRRIKVGIWKSKHVRNGNACDWKREMGEMGEKWEKYLRNVNKLGDMLDGGDMGDMC